MPFGSNVKSQIFRTTDGGITWFEQFSDTLNYLNDICFIDNSNGWAVGENGVILHTINGGTNWFLQTSGTTSQLYSVSFIDQNNGAAVGDMAIILKTSDGGNTWYQQSDGMTRMLLDIQFTDINNGVAVGGTIGGDAVILRTSNGGTNWSLNLLGLGWLNALSFCDERNGFAVGDGGRIFRTTNGGESWLQQSSNTNLPLNDVVCIDSSLGVVVGGYTYYSMYTHDEFYQVQELLKTEDGGINWSKQSSGSLNALNGISFIGPNNGWIVGDRGIILHTTNGGVSFVEEEQSNETPTGFLLSQNYPNPFNPSTKIKYSVLQTSRVLIKVFDILGNEIETLVNEEKPVGTYELTWNSANLVSGIYFYQLRAGSFIETKKMILIK